MIMLQQQFLLTKSFPRLESLTPGAWRERRYRCECTEAFVGHNCAQHAPSVAQALDSTCQLAAGAKRAEGATQSMQEYAQFQKALQYFGAVINGRVDFNRLCVDVYHRREHGGVCNQDLLMHMKTSGKTSTVHFDCKHQPELYVVLEVCAKPCMNDAKNQCE